MKRTASHCLFCRHSAQKFRWWVWDDCFLLHILTATNLFTQISMSVLLLWEINQFHGMSLFRFLARQYFRESASTAILVCRVWSILLQDIQRRRINILSKEEEEEENLLDMLAGKTKHLINMFHVHDVEFHFT